MPNSIRQAHSADPDRLSRSATLLAEGIASRRWGPWIVLAAAFGLAGAGWSVPSILSAAPAAIRLGNLAVGILFVAAGLVGVRYRRESPVGGLLVVAGVLCLVGRLQGADPPAIWLIAGLANVAWQAVVFYIVFSFPDRRLRSLSARLIVLVAVAYTLANNLFGLVTERSWPSPVGANPFFADVRDDVVDSLRVALLYVGGAFILVATLWLVRRWLAASPPLRRALTPIYLATFAVSTVALALRFGVGVVSPTTDPTRVVAVGLLIAFGFVPVAFLIGLLRARMARSAVADLVLRLGEVPAAGRMREALARALGDPTVEVLRWSDDQDGYVGDDGVPADRQVLDPQRAVTTIETEQGSRMAIVHDASLLDDPGLVSSVITAVRLTLDNERLEAQVQEQLEEVRASRARISAASDHARSRIERDIHDGAQQQLVAAALALQAVSDRLDEDSDMSRELEDVTAQLADAIDELRELARGIHPAVLTQRGLESALTGLARRSAVPVRLALSLGATRLPEGLETAAYFIVSEALANAQRHSGASEVELQVTKAECVLTVVVVDNGVGGASADRGTGMTGMRDRAETVGGTLAVNSPPGGPTEMIAELPLG